MNEVTRLKLASEDLSGSKSNKGAIEITGDNLEDLLAYDDLFLDYFNSFLTLPVFPQAVVYNRLTGAFDKVDSQHHELTSALSSNSPLFQYGPTDAERDSMLEWARKERLPLFLRTQLFRELKIVKLLLRPLDNNSASRNSSRNLRGYSRGTESYISSLSVCGENSGHDVCDEDIWGEPHYSALYRYQRPGSRALSLPTMTLFASAATVREKSWSKPPSADISNKSEEDMAVHFSESHKNAAHLNHTAQNKESNWMTTLGTRSELRKSNGAERNSDSKDSTGVKRKSSSRSRAATSSTENAFLRGARVLSAPVNFEEFLKIPRFNISDMEAIFGGPTFIQFDKEGINEEQTEADIRNLEGQLNMSLQQVKERILGSHRGFESFRKFLKGTTGEHLLDFWLECENFTDCLEDFDDGEVMEIRHVFFRNIQDKFKLKLTADAVEQISRAANNTGLSYNIFLRTQYDVLRRLRAYWVPRFLIHCEMTKNVRLDEDEEYKSSSFFPNLSPGSHALVSTAMKPSGKNQLPFFPSVSLVHSLPVLPEDIKDYARKLLRNIGDHDSLQRTFGRQQSASSTSSNIQTCTKLCQVPAPILDTQLVSDLGEGKESSAAWSSWRRPSKERFLLAISSDKLAGGPFRRYLTSHNNPQLLNCLLFWEDVTEYGAEEDCLSDRLLKLCHAWNIYKKYLSDDSPHKIELPEKEQNQLLANLKTTRDYIESSIFESAKIHAMEKLENAWIRFLKEDLKTFLDCRVRFEDESPPSTADVIEVTLTEHDVVIKRPMPWVKRIPGSTATERGKRLNKALVIAEDTEDDETKAQKKFEATSRKKEMERKRKRVIKAAYARQREMKLKRPSLRSEYDRSDEFPERSKIPRAVKLPTYQNLTGNKQLMSMFRMFVNEEENDDKDIFNKMQLHADIEAYFSLKDPKLKKAKATAITKLYLDSQSKRSVQLNNENLTVLVADEKDQPKPELLQEIQSSILPEIEEVFQNFVLRKADDLNVNPKDLVSMSQNELSKCVESEQAMILALNKRKSRGKSIQLDISGTGKNDMITQLNQAQDISSAVDSNRPPSVHSYRGSALNVRRADRRKQRHSVTSTVSASTGTGSNTSSTSTSEPKTTGRAQATREDKSEFLAALHQCAMGHLTMPMLYFYKYLLKHGEADGMPQIDKNLFFYIEVQKFKDGSHNFADEEILKKKLQSIVECFLDSAYLPTLQIDIPAEMHQKIMKAAQRYLNGKDVNPSLFDDAQLHVFRELLFYWAGFQKSLSANEDMKKRPVNKRDKMMQRRLEKIQNYQAPSSDFVLPSIPEGSVPFFSFSLSEGLKFKDLHDSFVETPVSDEVLRPQQSRKNTVLESDKQAKQSHEPSRRESLVTR